MRTLIANTILIWAVIMPAVAQAQAGAPKSQEPPPWSKGVSAEQRKKAEALVDEGFALHEQFNFEEAAAKYREALEYWAHPSIHFALGRIHLSLVKPLHAYRHFKEAVRWGADPLDEIAYKQAQANLQLLRRQLSELVVQCDEPGAQVHLDAKPWFRCPGEERQILGPGEYVIEVTKEGYLAVEETVTLLPGELASVRPHLVSEERGTVIKRRWQRWKSWAVVGAGVAGGLLGAGLSWRASRDLAAGDNVVSDSCELPGMACSPVATDLIARGKLERGVAGWSFVAGGAALTIGAVLLWLNRPRSYPSEDRGDVNLQLAPFVDKDAQGLSARISF